MNRDQQRRPKERSPARGGNEFGTVQTNSGGGPQQFQMGSNHVENHTYIDGDAEIQLLWSDPYSRIYSQPRKYEALRKIARPIAIKHPRKERYAYRRERLELPTMPRQQFIVKVEEIIQRRPDASRTDAEAHVTKRWREQGIWNEKWDAKERYTWLWKHEEPPDYEPYFQKEDSSRNASRPFNQFLYQLSKELEQMERKSRDWKREINVDIMTEAIKNVKGRWKEQNIWTKEWGQYPGMMWMHEDYREEYDIPTPAYRPHRNVRKAGDEPSLYQSRPLSPNPQPPWSSYDENHSSLSSGESSPIGHYATGMNHNLSESIDGSFHLTPSINPFRTATSSRPSSSTARRRDANEGQENSYEGKVPGVSRSFPSPDPESNMITPRGRIQKQAEASNESIAGNAVGSSFSGWGLTTRQSAEERQEDAKRESKIASVTQFLWRQGIPGIFFASTVYLVLLLLSQTHAAPAERQDLEERRFC